VVPGPRDPIVAPLEDPDYHSVARVVQLIIAMHDLGEGPGPIESVGEVGFSVDRVGYENPAGRHLLRRVFGMRRGDSRAAYVDCNWTIDLDCANHSPERKNEEQEATNPNGEEHTAYNDHISVIA